MLRSCFAVLALAVSTLLPAQEREGAGRQRPQSPRPVARAPRPVEQDGPQGEGQRGGPAVGNELARLRERLDQLRAQLDRLEAMRGEPMRDGQGPGQRLRANRGGMDGGGPGAMNMRAPNLRALRGRMAAGGPGMAARPGFMLQRLREHIRSLIQNRDQQGQGRGHHGKRVHHKHRRGGADRGFARGKLGRGDDR